MNKRPKTKKVESPKIESEYNPETGKYINKPIDVESISRYLYGNKGFNPNLFGTMSAGGKDVNIALKPPTPLPRLPPLNLETLQKEIDECFKPAKLMKHDDKPKKFDYKPKSVRKALFTNKSKNIAKKVNPQATLKMPSETLRTSLLNMDEVEDDLVNKKWVLKGSLSKSPVRLNCDLAPGTSSQRKRRDINIPEVIIENTDQSEIICSESMLEYCKLEGMCTTNSSDSNVNCPMSPINAISHLMQGASISNCKKTKVNLTQPNRMQEIEQSITEEELYHRQLMLLFQEEENCLKEQQRRLKEQECILKQKIRHQEQRHKQQISRLNNLLTISNNLQVDIAESKENVSPKRNRSSPRLQNRNLPLSSILKNPDLRTRTLQKNLAASCHEFSSPRAKQAMALYNSLRAENKVLETPKPKRATNSANINISEKIISQCYKLQDTPICNKKDCI